ncbi:hypothetical protein UC34_01290 [Pandoraea vervacti]|uniref:DUF2946 domain-containing protein n=1 Tax=Pandoraea vervacti TaxID=656178 RepID=A0ABM5SU47_9BURK|nr:hypothetical protein [Pandoraea vervacti]AJP55992.1 hypothetical protein UC34_01290 [Pandoraea vervacti]
MPSIDSVFRQWRARSRTPLGRGRSGWIAWLIVALLCVQMWGLQHEIVHARELSGVLPGLPGGGPVAAKAFSTLASATHAASDVLVSAGAGGDDGDDSLVPTMGRGAANEAAQSIPASHASFGTHHHHCHLFEGATLAMAMAVAVLQWSGAAHTAQAPLRPHGRSHASAVLLPFDSRAPPVAV